MDTETTTNTASILCTARSVLPFDDGRFEGAYEARKGSGHSTLAYNDPGEFQQYELDYEYVDDLPELQKLRISGMAGCAFCRALRTATLRLIPAARGKVVYTLRYVWRCGSAMMSLNKDSKLELHVDLNITPFSTGDSGEPVYNAFLMFIVDCKLGMINI